MKKLTVVLDDETAARASEEAARNEVSLSRFVGDLIRQHSRESQRRLRETRKRERDYLEAMKRWRAQKPFVLKGPAERYLTREEIHDRPVLRRR